jgi:hypothetical protein
MMVVLKTHVSTPHSMGINKEPGFIKDGTSYSRQDHR